MNLQARFYLSKFLWFLSYVANSIEMKVRHETTPISSTIFKMHALYYTDVQNIQ